MNALILVAHPDDEALFAGGLMAAYPEWNWRIVALTATPQTPLFRGDTIGHRDEWRILTVPEYESWKASVAAMRLTPDIVFTHNRLGEYGHPHHMAVHRIAHELFPRVFDFYVDAPSSIDAQHGHLHLHPVPTDGKRDRFLAQYGSQVLANLEVHQPELTAWAWEHEWFTGQGGWPV